MSLYTVACIDGSALSDSVADYAAWSATRMSTRLIFLNAVDDIQKADEADFSGQIGMDERQRLLAEFTDLEEKRAKLARQQGHLFLEAAAKHIKPFGLEPELRQRLGDLLETLDDIQHDTRLLVIGRQGKRATKTPSQIGRYIGHQVERVIRSMQRPVWVIPGAFQVPERIMIAYDHSVTAKKSVEMVAGSPLFKGLPVHVVMVGSESSEHQAQLSSAVTILEEHGFEDVTSALLSGDVEDTLNQYAAEHQISVMVMGAYGHSRIREFLLGSHTNAMILSAQIPLLLLR
ncbi:universal stress protein [Aliidiomarina sanyensis]|uniref:Universal stress protein UspA n=1 Tax=Aliidiomarina sanyensis TaxID=1249555 RepID=A0A432WBA0_9GAMM|nr:universal stress protein [Aliidiomarina sanyensis]RUO28734.1 universal stress protein UspA [Aliidiomarina sanyensis]